MSHPGSAPCPPAFAPGGGGPSSIVVVEIISIKPNTDLEGDDDFVPFYDNHADIYGFVTIDGETFDLPQIPETDFPHWEATGPRKGIFEKAVTMSPVPIRIDIWEGDSGATGGDDHVDICPAAGKRHLDFEFDLCGLTLSGDVNGSSQGPLEESGGSGSEAATIAFRVGLKDGRPISSDDLALVDLDLIQVTPRTSRIVARKGTVVMVRIANNHGVTINTTLRLRISAAGMTVDETFPLEIEAGEVKKEYLFADHPIMFPSGQTSAPIAVFAEIVDPGSAGLAASDCRLGNDRFVNRTTWKVVTTDRNFSLLWAKVGSLLDVGNYAPDAHFDEIAELGTGYIRAVFPLIGPQSTNSPIGIPPPPVTAAADFLVSVLSSFGLPADAVEPVVLTFELNGVAALLPYDRLMGVLPNKDWFTRFSAWSDVTGFSLGEFAPRAVIFLPRKDDGTQVGPQWTLPAHELGHTFGLSVDSRLKTSWVCDIDWPVVGHAACGLVGGFDEYNHSDPALQGGNPASGYWVKRGSEPAALASLADEQCDSHCLMGGSPVSPENNWPVAGRWIDNPDYDHLIDKLVQHPDPEIVFVSGMISWHDQIYVGRAVRLDIGVPDHRGNRGMYGFRFVDAEGETLGEVGLPVAWNHAEFKRVLPVTFFAVKLELPESSTQLEIWNRGTGTRLASLDLDRSVPEVHLEPPELRDNSDVVFRWSARDLDDSDLTYVVTVGPDESQRWPVAYDLQKTEFVFDKAGLAPGEYWAEVMALNSIRVGRSNQVTFRVERGQESAT
jgi:hypothetical protein